ncbi:MAG: hypothetical protein AAFY88_24555, partial [Acidobacteriota bacterium]
MTGKRYQARWFYAWALLPGALLFLAPLGVGKASGNETPIEAAADAQTDVGVAATLVAACSDCHDISGPGYARNPHAVLNRDPAVAARYGV